jgi:hypothetical protein
MDGMNSYLAEGREWEGYWRWRADEVLSRHGSYTLGDERHYLTRDGKRDRVCLDPNGRCVCRRIVAGWAYDAKRLAARKRAEKRKTGRVKTAKGGRKK